MTDVLRILLRDEERASAVLIWGCGAICAAGFLASLFAMAVPGSAAPWVGIAPVLRFTGCERG